MTDDMLMTVTVQRSPGGLMAVLKARCIARYQMHTVPGRPEELETNEEHGHYIDGDRNLVISFGYLHKSARIRQHGGERNREWQDTRDITFRDGWLDEVYAYLDPFFGYNPPTGHQPAGATALFMEVQKTGLSVADIATPETVRRLITGRPIQDSPQA